MMHLARDKWIRTFSPAQPGGLALVCFPFSGASADVYRDWPSALPDTTGVFGVQYPGRGPRFGDPLLTDFNEMVTRVEFALVHWIRPPFALFGHSLGAAIAFEVCRRLENRGKLASHLFVSGAPAPHHRQRRRLHDLPDEQL